jgi:large subunit ribosomal protein L38
MQRSMKKSAEASSIEEISLKEIRKEWLKTAAPFQIKAIAEHYNIFKDLFGEAFFVPRIPLSIGYQQTDGSTMPVYFGNQIKPYEVQHL